MNSSRPQFHLRRVDADGTSGGLEVFPLTALTESVIGSRRGFLGAGIAIGSLLGVMGGASAVGAPPSAVRGEGSDLVLGPAHRGRISGLAFGPGGGSLVSCSEDGTIKKWSLTEATVPKPLPAKDGPVTAVALSADGKTLVTGLDDGHIKVWGFPDGTLRKTLAGHSGRVTGLVIAADARSLLSSAMDGRVMRWALPSGQRLASWTISKEGVTALTSPREGRSLVAGVADGTIQIRSVPEGVDAIVLESAARRIAALAISRDGKTLASCGPDRSLTLWSLPDGKPIPNELTHPAPVTALAFTLGGGTLAIGSEDHSIRLHTLVGGVPPRFLIGHEAPVSSIVASPDGQLLASGDHSGVILLWDLAREQKRGVLFDPLLSQKDAILYTVKDVATGHLRTYTLPCGSPIPPNAVCVCNCVRAGTSAATAKSGKIVSTTTLPGSSSSKADLGYTMQTFPSPPPSIPDPLPPPRQFVPRAPRMSGSSRGVSSCSCNKVCVCIPVCQAHRLGHGDPVVRHMAREILLVMGEPEFAYMRWASSGSGPRVRKAIRSVMDAIRNGARPHPENWPGERECLSRLDHADEVIAIMAAQMLTLHDRVGSLAFDMASHTRIDELLVRALSRSWMQHALTR